MVFALFVGCIAMWVLFVKLLSPAEWWLEPKPAVYREAAAKNAAKSSKKGTVLS
jgi:hypothetical protein